MTPVRDIWLGLDTGGTYTDAVALDGERHIVASAKALTTHWDLAVGLGEAVSALLARLPASVRRQQVSLVSVSTTLATNAVVESRFSPICTILVGFDDLHEFSFKFDCLACRDRRDTCFITCRIKTPLTRNLAP